MLQNQHHWLEIIQGRLITGVVLSGAACQRVRNDEPASVESIGTELVRIGTELVRFFFSRTTSFTVVQLRLVRIGSVLVRFFFLVGTVFFWLVQFFLAVWVY